MAGDDWLGVNIQSVTDEIASAMGLDSTYGALIANVTAGGPADKGGLRIGDAIVEIDGDKIPDSRGLARRIAAVAPNQSVKIVLYRKGKRKTLSVTLGTFPTRSQAGTDGTRQHGSKRTATDSVEVLGLKLSVLDAALRKKHKVPAKTTSGMVVTGVKKGSAAHSKGVRTGHVIREVGGEVVS